MINQYEQQSRNENRLFAASPLSRFARAFYLKGQLRRQKALDAFSDGNLTGVVWVDLNSPEPVLEVSLFVLLLHLPLYDYRSS